MAVTVESCVTISADELASHGWLRSGERTEGTVRLRGFAIDLAADLTGRRPPHLRLRYRAGETLMEQCVPLAPTTTLPCTRWWFVDECGRRVGRLHLPPGGDRFRGRLAAGLTYECRRVGARRRRAIRAERIASRLGFYGVNGIKPSGMRARRYEKLLERLQDLRALRSADAPG
jgi:hypothetical protein